MEQTPNTPNDSAPELNTTPITPSPVGVNPPPATREYVDALKKAYQNVPVPVMPMQFIIDHPIFESDGVTYTIEPYIDELRAFGEQVDAERMARRSTEPEPDPFQRLFDRILSKEKPTEKDRLEQLLDMLLSNLHPGGISKRLNMMKSATEMTEPMKAGLLALFEAEDTIEADETTKLSTIPVAFVLKDRRFQLQVTLIADESQWLVPGTVRIEHRGEVTDYTPEGIKVQWDQAEPNEFRPKAETGMDSAAATPETKPEQ